MSAQFTCYSAVGCSAGDELTGFTTAEACCLSVNGLSFNDGTCRVCIGKVFIAKSPNNCNCLTLVVCCAAVTKLNQM